MVLNSKNLVSSNSNYKREFSTKVLNFFWVFNPVLNPLFEAKKFSKLPEDPEYSTPDGSHFLFFPGRYVRDTMCNSVFFFQLFRVHFQTIKTGT